MEVKKRSECYYPIKPGASCQDDLWSCDFLDIGRPSRCRRQMIGEGYGHEYICQVPCKYQKELKEAELYPATGPWVPDAGRL
jgi:hypothetical protein